MLQDLQDHVGDEAYEKGISKFHQAANDVRVRKKEEFDRVKQVM